MRHLLLLILTLFSAAFSFAQDDAPEADTFLWKINKSGRPDSYLLGTVHLGKTNTALPAAYRRVLRQTAQLVVESDADALTNAQTRQLMLLMYDTRPLTQTLGETRLRTLQGVLQQGGDAITLNPELKLKPWALWLNIESQFYPNGYSYRFGIDNLLIQTAKQQKKPVIALESVEPLYYFNALPEAAVLRALDSFAQHHQDFLNDSQTLFDDYRHQRAKKIWADISNPDKQLQYLPPQDRALWQTLMYQKLLTERNQRWLPRLIDILPQRPTLIAVGAAHLFGGQGLIRRLRQVGYRVEAVKVAPF
ncbi:TraB/GumN family protein [Neisseria perflava]|uniref:TraB/GumN family protein n=1 Tax=Neisseria perflava TaxID=33053 RepID=UPI00209ECA40|nr:TraB/GumN family protein [Neisseria perflava]MCP1661023.1 uncharacterized protein YbaP (TraB family) [Neisseria perflava]MCP1772897.1 uncharacterized protein YbaP (TraB family) [Neisseria perflava]